MLGKVVRSEGVVNMGLHGRVSRLAELGQHSTERMQLGSDIAQRAAAGSGTPP